MARKTFIVLYRHKAGVLDMLRNLKFGIQEFETHEQAEQVYVQTRAIDRQHRNVMSDAFAVVEIDLG